MARRGEMRVLSEDQLRQIKREGGRLTSEQEDFLRDRERTCDDCLSYREPGKPHVCKPYHVTPPAPKPMPTHEELVELFEALAKEVRGLDQIVTESMKHGSHAQAQINTLRADIARLRMECERRGAC